MTLAMFGCADLDGRGNDLRVIFQFNRQPQAGPRATLCVVILNKQVAQKVVMLHMIYDPYVSKNLKREPAMIAKLNPP